MFRVLQGLVMVAVVVFSPQPCMSDDMPDFPYPLERVAGKDALSRWEELVAQGDGVPVILGSASDVARVGEWADSERSAFDVPKPADVIAKAKQLQAPQAIWDMRQAEQEAFAREYPDFAADAPLVEEELIGSRPIWPSRLSAPISYYSWRTGKPYDDVYITVLPTRSPTHVPAWLNMGGWNANPAPEYHVALLEHWHELYGAVPVVMGPDIIELRVDRRPVDWQEALDVAKTMYLYDHDIVWQGVGSIAALAASLQVSDYWYFWWD
ncbi:MAG: DUF4253 domain-containing protein [Brevirhabdus sp.]